MALELFAGWKAAPPRPPRLLTQTFVLNNLTLLGVFNNLREQTRRVLPLQQRGRRGGVVHMLASDTLAFPTFL